MECKNLESRNYKVIAVDFDGVLCEDKYPKIGEPNDRMLDYILKEKENGNKIILWTCRKGIYLNNAVKWCKKYGIEFDAVNENLPEMIQKYHGDTRKIFADVYIDDNSKSFNPYDYINHLGGQHNWDFRYANKDELAFVSRVDLNLWMYINRKTGIVKFVDLDRVSFVEATDYPFIDLGETLATDYIHKVYPISMPYVPDSLTHINVTGSAKYTKINLFYVGLIRFGNGDIVDVDQWFIFTKPEKPFTPISHSKASRIIRKYKKKDEKEKKICKK